jgi:hypothetical protein
MQLKVVILGLGLSALLPGPADAGLLWFGRRCTTTTCCQGTNQVEPCRTLYQAGASEARYNAFAGPDGLYGVNTLTGQVYRWDTSTETWKPLAKAIP